MLLIDSIPNIRCHESDIPLECFSDGAIVSLTIEVTYCLPAASKCQYKFSDLWIPPNSTTVGAWRSAGRSSHAR
ncbi:MAG TPA: hypothetical protein VEZ90_00620 [Blastocatellia bacterium]|nr:hypothetical protein [Blastocatellia bacterium]